MTELIKKNKTIIIIILIGVLVRLLIMPFTFYVDILSSTFREWLYINDGVFVLSKFPELILSGYLFLVKPFVQIIPETINNLRPPGDHEIFKNAISGIEPFLHSPIAPRTLFLLKFPYLIVELVLIAIFWNLFKDNKEKIWFFSLYWLNPILIYALYAWGRYEIFPILFAIVSILYAKNNRNIASLLFLGLAIMCRDVYIFLLPIYLIYFYKNWRFSIVSIIVALLPKFLNNNLFGFLGSRNYQSLSEVGLSSSGYSLSHDYVLHSLVGSDQFQLSLLIIALLGIFGYYVYYHRKKDFSQFISINTVVLISFLVLSRIHPHYMSWLIPFLIVAVVLNKKLLWPYILFSIIYFVYYDICFGASVSLAMLRPFNYELFSSTGSFFDQILLDVREQNILTISRTIYFSSYLYILFTIFKHENDS